MATTALPMIDLHRHLDGNIRAQTILDLGRSFNIELPGCDADSLRPFIQVQGSESDLLSFLQKLDLGVSVLGDLDACRRVAYENVEDAFNAGLDYAELRFSPYYMAKSHELPLEGVVEAVADGIRAGCRDNQIDIRLTGILSRTFGLEACEKELESLIYHKTEITAIDLAGNESGFPCRLYQGLFKKARNAGFRVTVHAGEAGDADNIWEAIHLLGAERIGHGVRAITDPRLMDYIAEHRIGVESCLTSNVQTNTVDSLENHPLIRFLHHGILASINTDDPAVQGIDIKHELNVAALKAGLSPAHIQKARENALETAFLSVSEKESLKTRSFSEG